MKKILTLFLISLVTLILCSCKKEIDFDYKYDIIDYNFQDYYAQDDVYEKFYYSHLDNDLFEIYEKHLINNVDIYEAEVVDKSEIVGYIKKSDMDNLINLYSLYKIDFYAEDFEFRIFDSGYSSIYSIYGELLYEKVIDHNYYIYVYNFEDKIPYYLDDMALMFTYDTYIIRLSDGTNFVYVMNSRGMPTADTFYPCENRFSLEFGKYLKLSKPETLVDGVNDFRYTSIKVEQYNGVEAIKFISYGSDEINKLEDKELYYNFFDLLKESILSEEKELKDNTTYYFAYNKVKELLFK